IHNAWLRTIEDGQHTGDIWSAAHSQAKLGTQEFAQAVVDRLGQSPQTLKAVHYATESNQLSGFKWYDPATAGQPNKEPYRADVFTEGPAGAPADLPALLSPAAGEGISLKMISNRGTKVWPHGHPDTFCVDHWRCRFLLNTPLADLAAGNRAIAALLGRIADN